MHGERNGLVGEGFTQLLCAKHCADAKEQGRKALAGWWAFLLLESRMYSYFSQLLHASQHGGATCALGIISCLLMAEIFLEILHVKI